MLFNAFVYQQILIFVIQVLIKSKISIIWKSRVHEFDK